MSNFAIKGHSTRGKEIIEILQMFGGINKYNINYTEDNLWYCLRYNDNVIIATYPNSSIKTVLSIEEFLEKFPYKLNELVLCDDGLLGIITKMEWDCEKSDMKYHISFNTHIYNKWYNSKNIKCKFMDEKGKKLAIKGHSTRGKEVIEIFELLGGKNYYKFNGNYDSSVYYIRNDSSYNNVIDYWEGNYPIDFMMFTLEQFLEKFPYKVGDKVNYIKYNDECPSVYTIQRMWWNGVTIEYLLESSGFSALTKDLQPYKEETMDKANKAVFDANVQCCDIMNHLIKGETMENKPNLLQQLIEYFDNTPRDVLEKEWNELSYLNEIGPTVDEYLECVKKYRQSNQYPKTYDECCEVLGCKANHFFTDFSHDGCDVEISDYEDKIDDLLQNFRRLRYCRDAYWKIAGEQMGLGKPWEPDWAYNCIKYIITVAENEIYTDVSYIFNYILVFPTEEMRDAFLENFGHLIELCKELL